MSRLLSFFGVSAQDRDPTSGFWYGSVGPRSASGVAVNENTALNLAACWAATRIFCGPGSSLPLNLMQRQGVNTNIARKHRVHRILHNEFNPELGATFGRAFGFNMQVNHGNFCAEIVRTNGSVGDVTALYPIHTSRVDPVRFDDGQRGYRVRNDDGTTDDFLARDMFHVPSMITSNGFWGKGVIQNARESIGSAMAANAHAATFFANGATPGIIIEGGKFKDKEDRASYRQQWMDIHGGPGKGNRPALLPEGAKVSFMQFNARDSQFLETREHDVNEIARWYGVPPHMLYDLRRATYTNIEHQGIDFVVYSLVPWLKLWEEEIWRKLLTKEEQEEYFAKHAVEGLLRGDSAARAAFYKALFEIGALCIDDILELEDRNPIGEEAGGQKRFVPLNFTTAEKAGEQPIEAPAAAKPEPAKELAAYTIEAPQLETVTSSFDPVGVETRCRALIADTMRRMLNKESRACKAAAENNKSPKEFFAWLDSYYENYSTTIAEAVRGHVDLLMFATNDSRDVGAMVAQAATEHVTLSKEQILQATEVPASDWKLVPERISACGVRWQAERTHLQGI
jgi:HK97 family phage portal protein